MTSLVSASQVVTGQVQSLDSVRAHALPSDAMIFASATKIQPVNQNPGSYAIVESSGGVSGNPTINVVAAVTQSPFADLYKEGSMYFPGTAPGSNIAVTLTSSYAFTGGLTAEAWMNYVALPGAASPPYAPMALGAFNPIPGTTAWSIGLDPNGKFIFYYYSFASPTNSLTANTNISVSSNTWNHLAVSVTSGGVISMYVNGVQQLIQLYNGSTSSYGTSALTVNVVGNAGTYNYLGVGGTGSSSINGYVSCARVVYGASLYSASFTVPSAPLSPSATGTNALLLRAGQNSPTIQSGALTFDRGLKQFMNFGPQTFNIVTQGFTAVWRGTLTGVIKGFDPIFVAGPIFTNGWIALLRSGSTSTFYLAFAPSNAGTQAGASGTFTLNQNTTYVITARYTPSTQLVEIWVNGVNQPAATATITTASLVGDRTTSGAYMFATGTTDFNSASSNTLAIYNRALSNVEILNAYSALTTATTNAPIEIGDANGTPALSIAGDGRVNVTKLGQTSNVVPWPPAAMTGYDTVINGQVYKARASTENTGYYAWYAFDKNTTNFWNWAFGAGNYYPGGAGITYGYYTGPVTTTDTQGTVYKGEWIQIQLPSRIALSSYTVYGQNPTYDPGTFWVLGSNDGVNWTLVNSQVSVPWTTTPQTLTFQAQSPQAFSYFRMVIGAIMSSGTNNYSLPFSEWTLYGTADTAQTLTVAQPVTLSYGAQTASLTGISGDKYVPQDFSSSGLNVPAYVVSNTATVANTVQYSSFGPFAGEGSVYFPGGTGAYVNFGQPAQLAYNWTSYDFTIEMFVFSLFTPSTDQRLFARDYEQLIYITTNNTLRVYMAGVTGPTSGAFIGGAVPQNQWSHVAVSWSQSAQTMYISVNGSVTAVALTAGTPTYAGTRNAVMGTWAGTNGLLNTSISNLRFTRGLALYTTTFVPPTAPLQPIQGVTQAGTPYGTVLLLRNAPAPGRVLTSKFGGANSSSVLSFPPAAMTGYSTALNSGYGQGTYVASASSELGSPYQAWQAFDKIGTTIVSIWASYASYASTAPYGTLGSNVTVDVSGSLYAGEWLQIQMPSSIVLSNYSLTGSSQAALQSPSRFWILGSRDGTNWSLVDSRTNVSSWVNYVTQNFSVSSGQAFTHFRIVVNQLAGYYSLNPQCVIGEWTLNGIIEGPSVSADGRLGLGVSNPVQALEVAGNMIVNGTVSSGSPFTFKNALYNGDMRINQRGISTNWASPTTAIGYTVDRWYASKTSGLAYAQLTTGTSDIPFVNDGIVNYLRVGRTAADTTTGPVYMAQALETRDSYRLCGKSATLSLYYRTGSTFSGGNVLASIIYGTGTDNSPLGFTGTIYQNLNLTATTAWTKASFSAQIPLNATQVGLIYQYTPSSSASSNDYFDITGVQLEKGTLATPFEFRNYAQELALCQRYYQQFTSSQGGSSYMRFASGIAYTATQVYSLTYLPVTMRIAPTMSSNSAPSTFQINTNTSFIPTSFGVGDGAPNIVGMYWNASGMTGGHGAIVLANATTSAYLGFSAEL